MAPILKLDPMMGEQPLLKAFIIIILGGLGSIPGAILSVVVFTLMSNYLLAFYPWDLLLQGLIIVLFMNYLPRGLGSVMARLFDAADDRSVAAERRE